MNTYKSVDIWLGSQSHDIPSSLERLKWSFIYLSDAYVELFNHLQVGVAGNYSRSLSRLVAALTVVVPWFVAWAL